MCVCVTDVFSYVTHRTLNNARHGASGQTKYPEPLYDVRQRERERGNVDRCSLFEINDSVHWTNS